MKKFLLSLFLTASFVTITAAQDPLPLTPRARGEYLGVCYPVNGCSNERLAIQIYADGNGNLTGNVVNWLGAEQIAFEARWPFYGGGRFNSNVSGIGTTVRGTFAPATGRVSGTVKIAGGCTYTYTAGRRYKVPQ